MYRTFSRDIAQKLVTPVASTISVKSRTSSSRVVSPNELYKHYKGSVYQVLHIAKHTEAEEPLVIYRNVKETQVWARPYQMFVEDVEIEGVVQPRFTLVQKDTK
ncbi:DUF1653 domain-containing protein [Yasminevirus sp. GU-2018]|uniref:DUF1653 domain-containing protein n=1 Tax=Yasminevirus sp. GU-2018 TaxID=2420051 RepID=A0A5K0U8A8_9VIRU|nr:DUF1653 domain-containing protein [Yasminevirus sp. GU-2018]